MTKPRLNSFYSIEEFYKSPFTRILGWRTIQLSVPSEVYIDSPSLCIPLQARAWSTDFYIYEGKLLDSGELAKTPDFRGVSNYPNVVLLEVWEDQGCDGHLDYRMTGYIFMEGIDLKDKKYPLDEILTVLTYEEIGKR